MKTAIILILLGVIGYMTFPMWDTYIPECKQVTTPLTHKKGVTCLWN